MRSSPHGCATQVNQQKVIVVAVKRKLLLQPMHSSPAITPGAQSLLDNKQRCSSGHRRNFNLLIHALPSAHDEPVRLPTLARTATPAFPCCCPHWRPIQRDRSGLSCPFWEGDVHRYYRSVEYATR